MIATINGIPAQTIELDTEEIVFVENEMHVLLIYKLDGEEPSIKITGEKNMLALRNLLNKAYPACSCKGGCSCGILSQTCDSKS